MSEFKKYRRTGLSEMRPWKEGDNMTWVSVSEPDRAAGSPKLGDMIARNPKNHVDQWLVAKQYFEDNLEEVGEEQLIPGCHNTAELQAYLVDRITEALEEFVGHGSQEADSLGSSA